jgi:hypothetical protein
VYYIVVLSLGMVHAALNQAVPTKMLVFLVITAAMGVYTTAFPIYRCYTSAGLYALTWWAVAANAFMGYLRAIDYQSHSMVDANFTQIIAMCNLTVMILMVFCLVIPLLLCLRWPVNISTIKELSVRYRFLLVDLRNAQRMILLLR